MSGIRVHPVLPLDKISDYEYYDTPDGHDIHLKAYYCWKQTFRIGSLFMAYDILGISKPVGWVATLDRFWYLFKPMTVMSLAYPITANISCLVRKKDDEWNHVLAASVIAGLLGKYKSAYTGGFAFLPLTLGCGMLKNANMLGYENYPESYYHMYKNSHYSMNPNVYKNDYSMYAQRPKGWVLLKEYEAS